MKKEEIRDEQIRQDTNEWQYQMEELERALISNLKATREMPGLELSKIANALKQTLKVEEIKSLIKELNYGR